LLNKIFGLSQFLGHSSLGALRSDARGGDIGLLTIT
jgi:hypothetical protein